MLYSIYLSIVYYVVYSFTVKRAYRSKCTHKLLDMRGEAWTPAHYWQAFAYGTDGCCRWTHISSRCRAVQSSAWQGSAVQCGVVWCGVVW